MRTNFFKTIGYKDTHADAPRTHPESITECQRFRAYLRSHDFINLVETRAVYRSLGGEYELSEELKSFSSLAKKAREEYILEVFHKKNPAPLFKPIPITKEEAIAQKNELNMTNNEIKFKIESLLEQMSRGIQQKYRGFKSKSKSDLLSILQEVKCLFDEGNEVENPDFTESSENTQ